MSTTNALSHNPDAIAIQVDYRAGYIDGLPISCASDDDRLMHLGDALHDLGLTVDDLRVEAAQLLGWGPWKSIVSYLEPNAPDGYDARIYLALTDDIQEGHL